MDCKGEVVGRCGIVKTILERLYSSHPTVHDILCHGSAGAEDKGSILSSESEVVIDHKAFGSERSDTWLAWAQFEKTEHHLPSAKKLTYDSLDYWLALGLVNAVTVKVHERAMLCCCAPPCNLQTYPWLHSGRGCY